MKKLTIGVFAARDAAEKAINELHNKEKIPTEDISYIYRNTSGEVKERDADDIARDTMGESIGKGATVGGTLGALAGIATFAGILPVIGPLFVAGPLAAALGFSGAAGAAVAGGAAGAAVGSIVAALGRLGLSSEHAQRYEDHVSAGNILVTVHTDEQADVIGVLTAAGAVDVESYAVSV
ncbi:MAG TPA: hypothetical protein VEB18_02130 [Candidatus Paceibacterota bacterium]|nr:hypothetical protein [Candidatus Paceibacterota bacterium]